MQVPLLVDDRSLGARANIVIFNGVLWFDKNKTNHPISNIIIKIPGL